MKLHPNGCPPATGESASLVIIILPGEFDPIFSWPFNLIFRINIINLSEPGDTWTKIVDPKDNQKTKTQPVIYDPAKVMGTRAYVSPS